ncbi:MAG: radical SAM protein, partial [Chitinophagaceae bacterium]|nr:radical SAM protein [Chitinophagaceae bacterium]
MDLANISTHHIKPELKAIAQKVQEGKRITDEEGLFLFEHASLGFVGSLANEIRQKKNGDKVFFNRNFHIEPTNVCVFSCQFCAYSKLYAKREEGWELSIDQMLHIVKKYDNQPITEVHIVGGVHPKMNLQFFADLLKAIKTHRPALHIKAFTAV